MGKIQTNYKVCLKPHKYPRKKTLKNQNLRVVNQCIHLFNTHTYWLAVENKLVLQRVIQCELI